MTTYIIRRLLLFIPTILIVTIIIFLLMWIVPGDTAMLILTGNDPNEGGRVNLADVERLREELGLNQPVHVQYGDWIWNMVRGDLGESLWYQTPVVDELGDRFLTTIQLAVMGILMAFVVAVPLGILSAVKQDTLPDYMSRIFALLGIAMPTFLIAIIQMVFPALAIALHDLAFTARVTRSSMLEVMRDDYVRTARAKGLTELMVIARHALKNALLPIITVSGYQFGRLLGRVIIVEVIFLVPGVGTMLIDAIHHRDFVVIQAVVVLVAAVVMFLNLVIDIVYGVLDPRIRYQ
ncbi:Glutathione transport system permease protein GsiC [Geodia barretti]|uniref:Glutathione transport system permease protein GsiC n=1 Tax=Geodia barretti TaxID=519541 RepID=A0AA35QXM0_GEOBA|nr:Glutathione transport system permease protein GsiC [Geodia barretti]